MSDAFFERPILNSPYAAPARHWELDADGQPTNRLIEARRRSELITPVPQPRKSRGKTKTAKDQGELTLGAGAIARRDDPQRLFRPGLTRGPAMKLHYYPETDSLYIELSDGPGTGTHEIADGLNADLDAQGRVVGLDIDNASRRLDLATLDVSALHATGADSA